jgi:hypothetical protein
VQIPCPQLLLRPLGLRRQWRCLSGVFPRMSSIRLMAPWKSSAKPPIVASSPILLTHVYPVFRIIINPGSGSLHPNSGAGRGLLAAKPQDLAKPTLTNMVKMAMATSFADDGSESRRLGLFSRLGLDSSTEMGTYPQGEKGPS